MEGPKEHSFITETFGISVGKCPDCGGDLMATKALQSAPFPWASRYIAKCQGCMKKFNFYVGMPETKIEPAD